MISVKKWFFEFFEFRQLSQKLSLSLTLISFFFLCFVGLFAIARYNSLLSQTISSRFLVIAEDIINTLSDGLNLGFDIQELATTQHNVETIQRTEEGIHSINVFKIEENISDEINAGKIIYSTQLKSIQGNIPASWIDHARHLRTRLGEKNQNENEEKFWFIDKEDEGILGVLLFNNFQQVIGGVVIKFDQKIRYTMLIQFSKKIFSGVIILTLFLFIIFTAYFYIAFRPFLSSIKKMHTALLGVQETQTFLPFIRSNDTEEIFYGMYKKIKSLFDVLEMIENNACDELPHEKRSS